MVVPFGAIGTYACGHRVLQGEPGRGPDFDLSGFINELRGEHEHVRGLRRAEEDEWRERTRPTRTTHIVLLRRTLKLALGILTRCGV